MLHLVWKDVADFKGYNLKELVQFLAWIPSILMPNHLS